MQIGVSFNERKTFESWQTSTDIPAAYALRARAVLLVSAGVDVSETANTLGVPRQCISGEKGVSVDIFPVQVRP